MPRLGESQLTLDVKLHPQLEARKRAGEPVWLTGSISGKLELPIGQDLNSGDELVVTVADHHGDVIASGYLSVKAPKFTPIEDPDLGVIGMEREHSFKIVEVNRPQQGDE